MKKIERALSRLKAFDVIALLYLLIVGILILFFHRGLESWGFYVAGHFMLIALIVAFVNFSESSASKLLTFLRYWYPLVLYTFLFEEITAIVNIIFPFWAEEPLIKLDYALFGVHPTVWFENIASPWLTEYMEFSYFTYFLLIPIAGGVLYVKNKKRELSSLLLNVSMAYYICYISFLFFPARGAWETLAHLHSTPLEGGVFKSLIDAIQNIGSIHGGAFPSSHVAAAFAVLFSTYKYERRAFYFLLPVVLSLAVSIVYTRYHYAVDSIAGFLVAAGCLFIYPKIENWWEKTAGFLRSQAG